MTWRELLQNDPDVPDRKRLLLCLKKWTLREFLLFQNDQTDAETLSVYESGIRRLRDHEPLQYILGEAPFYGRTFRVDPNVLIPRFDTEILTELALREIDRCLKASDPETSAVRPQGVQVLDLCTGSGCIALTLLLERPGISVTASDISAGALQTARLNESLLTDGIRPVRWVLSDLFQKIEGRFELIVTNPPYIRTSDIQKLDPEVRDHEPFSALDGGADGLSFIRRIACEARDHLTDHAAIVMEIGDEEGEEAARIFREAGYADVRIHPDLTGRDRAVSARKGRND